jgi:hypothetical protein
MDLRDLTSVGSDVVFVRPYPGLILAEVPRGGTHIPKALADSWVANGLVVRAAPPPIITVEKLSRPRRKP